MRVWTTTENLELRFVELREQRFRPAQESTRFAIEVQPSLRYQTMLGMGSSLEATTCSNLFLLPPAERSRVLERLVHPRRGIGMNLMRVCMGSSDFTGDPWYSYDDLPPGETDPELKRFSIAKDRDYLLPMMKIAQKKNRELLFFASPWSPPGWMKTTGTMIGGQLLPQWYSTYAQYFVRFIQAYAAEGIPIHAVTVQNEPGVDRSQSRDPKWHYPSCHWTAEQERDFIRDHLRPALRAAGLRTEIWCYDHNYNVEPRPEEAGLAHPRTILADPAAAAAVKGVAFHGYAGEPDGMTRFHSEFPHVPLYFTEGSVFSIWGASDLTERLRNWASSYNAWVTMLDDRGRPNNGPFPATKAILKLHSDTRRVEELFEFYSYGHFMKFIQRGAVRIGSAPATKEFNHVAFVNPDGSHVAVLANVNEPARPFTLRVEGREVELVAPGKSVVTVVWGK